MPKTLRKNAAECVVYLCEGQKKAVRRRYEKLTSHQRALFVAEMATMMFGSGHTILRDWVSEWERRPGTQP